MYVESLDAVAQSANHAAGNGNQHMAMETGSTDSTTTSRTLGDTALVVATDSGRAPCTPIGAPKGRNR